MKRRGIGLVLVLFVFALIGGTVSIIVAEVAQIAKDRKDRRARTFAQVLLDSGIAYAHTHHDRLTATRPAGEVALPTDDLLPAPTRAQLALKVQPSGAIRIRAEVDYARSHATEQIVIPAPKRPTASTRSS